MLKIVFLFLLFLVCKLFYFELCFEQVKFVVVRLFTVLQTMV